MIIAIILVFLSIPALIIAGMNIYDATQIRNCWMVHYKTGHREGPFPKFMATEMLSRPDVNYIVKTKGLGKRTLYRYDDASSWFD